MRTSARLLVIGGAGAAALAVIASGIAPAVAGPGDVAKASLAGSAIAAGPVSSKPATGTPSLTKTASHSQVIRQLVQCGGTMYAVGSFSQITKSGTVFSRNNIFSFKATAPYTVTSWNPNVDGVVNSIALTSNCAHAYIGGSFHTVHGTAAHNIAEIRTDNGTVVTRWRHRASAEINTLLLAGKHLLAGGKFTFINGSGAHRYYASLSPSTGSVDGYLNLNISGHYVYAGVVGNDTQVYNQQLSPAGGHVLVEGIFTSVGGKPRQQIFMLNLSSRHGNVSGWNSAEFSHHCADKHPFYVTAAAWAPGASKVYVADTGFAPFGWKNTFPLTGLCDAVAAFPGTRTGGLAHIWVNYSGCDSFYSVAADSGAVYAAGHPRWGDNAKGCNKAGPGSVPDRGMQGHNPATGRTMVTSSGKARYTMSRANADDMLRTRAGLWIASTDRFGSSWCNGVGGHAGICFLPN